MHDAHLLPKVVFVRYQIGELGALEVFHEILTNLSFYAAHQTSFFYRLQVIKTIKVMQWKDRLQDLLPKQVLYVEQCVDLLHHYLLLVFWQKRLNIAFILRAKRRFGANAVKHSRKADSSCFLFKVFICQIEHNEYSMSIDPFKNTHFKTRGVQLPQYRV